MRRSPAAKTVGLRDSCHRATCHLSRPHDRAVPSPPRRDGLLDIREACCPAGDGCATGAPSTCSAECRDVFLGWMDEYNHGSCMPLVPTVAHSLPLGDLEASCRESLSTDDGQDANAIDCPTAAMPVLLACASETGEDAEAFCESDCYDSLAPYLEECSAVMPGYLTTLLAGALALEGSCQRDDVCDMTTLVTACQNDPPSSTGELDCENTCLQNMFVCRDDPLLTSVLGPGAPSHVTRLQMQCDAAPDGVAAGDGVCDIHALLRCPIPLDGGCEHGDVVCMCMQDCIKEYMDCVDSPYMAQNRADIQLTIGLCHPNDPLAGSGPQFAGDGRCNVLSANQMCDVATLAATDPTTGERMNGKEMCSNPCVREMVDCIDSPAMAPYHRQIGLWQNYCGTAEAQCLPVIADMGGVLDETCCSGAGLPACNTGPPRTCVTGCAAMYMPFWSACGGVLAHIADRGVLGSLSHFNSVCETSHPHLVPRPPPPPPPALPPPPPPPLQPQLQRGECDDVTQPAESYGQAALNPCPQLVASGRIDCADATQVQICLATCAVQGQGPCAVGGTHPPPPPVLPPPPPPPPLRPPSGGGH